MQSEKKQKLKELILNTKDLPTLPTTVTKLLEIIDNPKTTAQMLGAVITADPVLTAKVLKVANSAFYGFPRKIGTLNLAVVVLGFGALKHLCLSVGVMDVWNDEGGEGILNMNDFWRHSIATAVLSRVLARKVRYDLPGEAFVAGLVHDIGKLVLNEIAKDEYSKVLETGTGTSENEIQNLELQILGATHGEIGGWLAEQWNFPQSLVLAIKNHHQNELVDEDEDLQHIIRFANILSSEVGYGYTKNNQNGESEISRLSLSKQFKIDETALNREILKSEFEVELEKSEVFFSLLDGNK